MKTFRYVYGITLGDLLLKHADRALQHKPLTDVHHGRSASGIDECGALTEIRAIRSILDTDGQKKKLYISTWMGTSKKKVPIRFDDGLCE